MVGRKSKSVKVTIHLVEASRISLHFTNVPLLVFVTLQQNKVEVCANNRSGWLSEASTVQYFMSTEGYLFLLPFVSLWSCLFLRLLLSPLCHSSDWMPGLGMNTSASEFSCFAPTNLPPLPPQGLPWSVSCSYSAHESSEAKTWASDPQFLLLFLPNCNNVGALWVHIWKENRVFPALQRAQSQDAGFFREILTLQVWFILGHLVVNVSWDQDRQYIEMSKDALNRSRFTLASFGFLLRDFRKSARTTSSFVYPAFPSIRYMHVRLSPSFPYFALV